MSRPGFCLQMGQRKQNPGSSLDAALRCAQMMLLRPVVSTRDLLDKGSCKQNPGCGPEPRCARRRLSCIPYSCVGQGSAWQCVMQAEPWFQPKSRTALNARAVPATWCCKGEEQSVTTHLKWVLCCPHRLCPGKLRVLTCLSKDALLTGFVLSR